MIEIRPGQERGYTEIGWLKSYHTFSFGEYYDPKNRGFSDLRVINDDIVQPNSGFGTHPHQDMEILTYVLEGTLEHKDSMGNGSLIRPGEVQRMSAGTGVTHSEFNPSETESVHLLQIWIYPERRGLAPGYEQKTFDPRGQKGRLILAASPDGEAGSVTIHQDARLYLACLEPEMTVSYRIEPNRAAWLHVATGKISLDNTPLEAGDGVKIIQTDKPFEITGLSADSQILLFDLKHTM